MDEQRVNAFLESLRNVTWFSHAGEQCDDARAVESLQAGWDREGRRMLEVWERQICALETEARASLGDHGIDSIFDSVSAAVHEQLYKGLCFYMDRTYQDNRDGSRLRQRSVDESLYPEIMDSIKRDLSWAGVEHVILVRGFFGRLLDEYQKGRWPCSWDGEYPGGRPVVL